MMDSFLSIWPKGLFGLNNGGAGAVGEHNEVAAAGATAAAQAAAAQQHAAAAAAALVLRTAAVEAQEAEAREAAALMLVEPDPSGRKRTRTGLKEEGVEQPGTDAASATQLLARANGSPPSGFVDGNATLSPILGSVSHYSGTSRTETPGLITAQSPRRVVMLEVEEEEDGDASDSSLSRPIKRFRGAHGVVAVSPIAHPFQKALKAVPAAPRPGSPLRTLPDDALAHCLSFLGGVSDRFALQCTSQQFRKLSNSHAMLATIPVGGDKQTGLHGIIREHDTPETAARHLDPYVQASNLEAIYMLGIIKSYCHRDVEGGIELLKHASTQGYVRASYALGLALRDSQPEVAHQYMRHAADRQYIPALQEILPARQMKERYGEPKAEELRLHLDPLCLNRLLSRYYVQSAELREVSTSHCWNPLCGRWAFKACVHHHNHHHHNHNTVRTSQAAPGNVELALSGAENLGGTFASPRRGSETSAASSGSDATAASTGSSNAAASSNSAEDSDSAATASSTGNPSSLAAAVAASSSSSSSSSNSKAMAAARQAEEEKVRVSRMKMCSRCCRAKYCSKLCQVYDWRSGRHKMECQFL